VVDDVSVDAGASTAADAGDSNEEGPTAGTGWCPDVNLDETLPSSVSFLLRVALSSCPCRDEEGRKPSRPTPPCCRSVNPPVADPDVSPPPPPPPPLPRLFFLNIRFIAFIVNDYIYINNNKSTPRINQGLGDVVVPPSLSTNPEVLVWIQK